MHLGGSFARPVATLLGGSVAAHVIAFAARPVLSRLYTPEAFGVLGVFSSLAGGLTVLATARYEDAVMLPPTQAGARRVQHLAGLLALGTAGLTLLALPFADAWAAWLGAPQLTELALFLPITLLALAWANVAQVGLSRSERFHRLSASLFVQAVVTVGVQIGWPGHTPAGLVLGFVAGAASFAGMTMTGLAGRPSHEVLGDESPAQPLQSLREVARRYRRFPLFGLPASAMQQLAIRLPPLALAAAFGPTVVGWFSIAYASLLVPVSVLTDAVGQVFFVRAAEARRAGRLGALTQITARRLIAATVFPVATAAVLGPPLFAWVFGEAWAASGTYARALAPWLMLAAVAPPLTHVFDVTERQRDEFVAGAAVALCTILGLGAGLLTGNIISALIGLGAGGTVGRAIQIAWIARVAGASSLHVLRDTMLWSAVAALALTPSALLLATGRFGLAVGAGVFASAPYALLVMIRATPQPAPPTQNG